jgi:hypothetical protein
MNVKSCVVVGVTAVAAFVPAAIAFATTGQPPSSEPIDTVSANSSEAAPTLVQTVQDATRAFRDVGNATGYASLGACVSSPQAGAMGIHYFRPDMLGIASPPNPRVNGSGTHTDFLKPAILLYEPQADGSVELVGVENLVFAKAWKDAGHDAPPAFHGVAYDTMADNPATPIDEAHNFEPHHDRHVWLYRENPNGVFNPFNPRVTCAHHKPHAHHHHTARH